MNSRISYRQGDILFVKVDRIPIDQVSVLALTIKEGETSGHRHKMIDGGATLTRPWNTNNDSKIFYNHQEIGYLEVKDHVLIGHEEHKPIYLSKGIYQILQQRTYNPLEGDIYGTD